MDPPSPASRNNAALAATWAPVALCVAAWMWTMPRLGRVPGAHSDEGWLLHMVEGVLHGEPAAGMNFYTGALHVRLLVPLAGMLGNSVATARLLAVVCNALALGLLMALVRRVVGREAGLWAGALVATSAAYVFMARNAIEVHMLGPLLALGGLWCCVAGMTPRWKWVPVAGGALLGLAVHNHVSAVGVPAGLVVAALVWGRRNREVVAVVGRAVVGAVVALLPRAVDALQNLDVWLWRGGLEVASPWWMDAPHVPGFILAAWSGSFFFERVAGPPGAWWWGGPLWLGGVLGVWWWRATPRRVLDTPARFVLLAWVVAVLVTLPMTRWLSASYLSIPLWVLPAAPVMLAAPLLDSPRTVWVTRGVLAAWCALQAGLVVANYHIAFDRTGGVVHAFPVGARLVESSAHLVRVDRLYSALLERGFTTLVADPFIGGALAAQDVTQQRLALVRLDAMNPPPSNVELVGQHAVLVYYNGPNIRTSVDHRPPELPYLDAGAVRWVKTGQLDPNFLVFEATRGEPP